MSVRARRRPAACWPNSNAGSTSFRSPAIRCAGCAGRLPADFRSAAGSAHLSGDRPPHRACPRAGAVRPVARAALRGGRIERHRQSTTVSLLLHRIIEHAPHAHVVILDPHGEYAHAFGDKARVWDVVEPPAALLGDQPGRTLRGIRLDQRRGSGGRSQHPQQVPANAPGRAMSGSARRPGHGGQPGALPSGRPDRGDRRGGRQAGKARRCLALHPAAAQPGALLQRPAVRTSSSTPILADNTLEKLLGDLLRIPNRARRFRSSIWRGCRPRSSTWWSRRCPGWCSTMQSARRAQPHADPAGVRGSPPLSAAPPSPATAAVRASWSGSRARGASTGCALASSRSARRSCRPRRCRSAARSWRCGSTTRKTSASSRPACPKARAT